MPMVAYYSVKTLTSKLQQILFRMAALKQINDSNPTSAFQLCVLARPSLFGGLDYWTGLLDSRKMPPEGKITGL